MSGAFPSVSTTAPPNPLTGTLDGIRVVDFSQIAAGPLCTMLLADMGADVIKVEPPSGDVGRSLGPPFANGESTLFMSLNRNKRSVVINLKSEDGRAEAIRLIETADVLVESFRPGVADRLGIGHDVICALFPNIVYCSISAYGQTGPWSDRPGVDGVLQAVTGLMSITGGENDPPSKVQAPVIDMVTGFQATIAVLAALRQRDHGAALGHLDVSLFASSLMLQQIPLAGYLTTGEPPKRCGSGAPYATPNEAYKTADGHILIAAYQPERWHRFCASVGVPDLATDPLYAELPARMANRQRLTVLLDGILSRRPTAEWLSVLEANDVICAPVSDYAGVRDSPQIDAVRTLVTCIHPIAGDVVMPGFAIGGTAIPPRYSSPTLGEHDDVLGNGC
ncbi:CaiB/BaiF CoA transferase family protein [Sphingomonas arantia]|uniref:CaiB/BaiF CoA transferase family protein n=1 Tax=Sphingomonas arantia TaxID=1460676 RepID=A0ABW4U145_9SPHN